MFDWALDTLLLGFKNETYGSWCFQQSILFQTFRRVWKNYDNSIKIKIKLKQLLVYRTEKLMGHLTVTFRHRISSRRRYL